MRKRQVQLAVKAAGGRESLARLLDVTTEAVRLWEKSGEIPVRRVLQVEEATKKNGRPIVTRHDLRPDIYPEAA